jgi:hypothetical protein
MPVTPATQPVPPVVIVPGLGGSRIYWRYCLPGVNPGPLDTCYKCSNSTCPGTCATRADGSVDTSAYGWDLAWFRSSFLTAPGCFLDKFKVAWDADQEAWVDVPNVETTAWRASNYDSEGRFSPTEDFGGLTGVASISDLPTSALKGIDALPKALAQARGYVARESVFGAPYDFRKIFGRAYWALYQKMLQDLIEHAVRRNGGRPALLFSHSLGCTVVKRFLHGMPAAWRDAHVGVWVPVNGALGGAPKAARGFVSGDSFDTAAIRCSKNCDKDYLDLVPGSGSTALLPRADVFASLADVVVPAPGGGSGGSGSGSGTYSTYSTYSTSVHDTVALLLTLGQQGTASVFVQESLEWEAAQLLPPGVAVRALVSFNSVTEHTTKTQTAEVVGAGTEVAFVYAALDSSPPLQKIMESVYHEQLFGGAAGGGAAEGVEATPLQHSIRGGLQLAAMRGDGTVPFMSLHAPKLWLAQGLLPNSKPTQFRILGNYSHIAAVNSAECVAEVLLALDELLGGGGGGRCAPQAQFLASGAPNPSAGCIFSGSSKAGGGQQNGAKEGVCQALCQTTAPGQDPFWVDVDPDADFAYTNACEAQNTNPLTTWSCYGTQPAQLQACSNDNECRFSFGGCRGDAGRGVNSERCKMMVGSGSQMCTCDNPDPKAPQCTSDQDCGFAVGASYSRNQDKGSHNCYIIGTGSYCATPSKQCTSNAQCHNSASGAYSDTGASYKCSFSVFGAKCDRALPANVVDYKEGAAHNYPGYPGARACVPDQDCGGACGKCAQGFACLNRTCHEIEQAGF